MKSFIPCLAVLSLAASGCSTGDVPSTTPPAAAGPAANASTRGPIAAAAFHRPHPADAYRDTAGVASLQQLRQMTASTKGASLGLKNAADVDRAQLGDAERVEEISCKSLAAYHPGDDVHALLAEKDAVYYPVSVDGEVVSSVAMGKGADGSWSVVGLGRASLAKAIDATGAKLARERNVTDHALVEVRSLHLRFLAHDEAGDVMLTPLQDVGDVGLKEGETASAARVLQGLSARAQATCGSAVQK